MRIIHLSDLHVLCDYRKLPFEQTGWRGVIPRFELTAMRRAQRYEEVAPRLAKLVQQVNAIDADHVVVTGDLTAIGADLELAAARVLLAPLRERLTVIPGNHDRYGPDDETQRRFELHFAEMLESDLPEYALPGGFPFVRLVGESWAFVGLDSTQVTPSMHYFMGRVGNPQLSALDRLLDDPRLRGRRVLVLVHHAPLSPRGQSDRLHAGLWDSDAFLAVVRGRVTAVHHGHVHTRYWHPPTRERPALFGAGSSTELGNEGFFTVDYLEDSLRDAVAVHTANAA